jgi:hypothetical protein
MNGEISTKSIPIRQRLGGLGSHPAFGYALSLFAVMRVVVSLWAVLVLAVTQAPTSPDDVLRPYQGMEPISGGVAELLLGVWQRFDTLWYLRIAAQGYAPRDGSTVFMGHIIETVQVERKRELAASFFQAGTGDDFRRALLTEYGICYVFHGPRERQLGDFDPPKSDYLTPAYHNSEVTIYRVGT